MVQFENENFDIQTRLKKMIPYFKMKADGDWMGNIQLVSTQPDDELFVDNWKKIIN